MPMDRIKASLKGNSQCLKINKKSNFDDFFDADICGHGENGMPSVMIPTLVYNSPEPRLFQLKEKWNQIILLQLFYQPKILCERNVLRDVGRKITKTGNTVKAQTFDNSVIKYTFLF